MIGGIALEEREHNKDIIDLLYERMTEKGIKQADLINQMNQLLSLEGKEPRFEKGFVSRILKRKREMNFKFLVYASTVLGFADGELYTDYINQYLIVNQKDNLQDPKVNKPRIKNFIEICIEKGVYEYCSLVVEKIRKMDNPPIDFLKELAHIFENSGLQSQVHYIYEVITRLITYELEDHSPIYLKKFMLQREMGLKKAMESAIELEVYIRYMDKPTRQLAYEKLIATYFALEDWDKVYHYCEEQIKLTLGVNEDHYGNALVYKSNAARHKGDYKLALELIDIYSQLNGEKFKQWAEINRLNVYIEMGDTSVIPQMLEWMKNNPNNNPANDPTQKVPFRSLSSIMMTYVKQCELEKIPKFLNDFADEIHFLCSQTNPFDLKYASTFLLARAEYFFLIGQMSRAIDDVIQTMGISINLKSYKDFAKCVLKYTQYSSYASLIQQSKFTELCMTATKLF